MTWIIAALAVVVVLAFVIFGGVGGITAVLFAAVLVGALIALNRTHRAQP